MLTLYTTPLSANGRKVLAVSEQLGLEARIVPVDVYRGEGRSAEYLAINPLGKIPTLVEGDFVLWESNAILQYLAEAHGQGRLLPADPRGRADVARWMFFEASHWQPGLTPVLAAFVGRRVVPALADTPDVPVDWADRGLAPLLAFVDAHLAQRQWFAGDALSIADFAMAGMPTYLRAAGFPFESFPGIAAWYARIEALDAWRRTAAGPWRT